MKKQATKTAKAAPARKRARKANETKPAITADDLADQFKNGYERGLSEAGEMARKEQDTCPFYNFSYHAQVARDIESRLSELHKEIDRLRKRHTIETVKRDGFAAIVRGLANSG